MKKPATTEKKLKKKYDAYQKGGSATGKRKKSNATRNVKVTNHMNSDSGSGQGIGPLYNIDSHGRAINVVEQ